MPLTLTQLLTPITVETAETVVLAILKLAGFPTTAWQETSIPRRFTRLVAELHQEGKTGLSQIVALNLLDFSSGDFLTAYVASFFRIFRAPATFTSGTVLLVDDGGAPYDNIQPGQIKVRSDNGLIYANTSGGSLGIGGELALTFKAEAAGAAYNVPVGAINEFYGTPLAGVNVSNPAIGATGTWITSAGADQQSDASLKLAARSKWATLGAGASPSYVSWAIEAAPTLSRVRVFDDHPNGPGTVKVVLANAAGGASADEVAAANALAQKRRSGGLAGVEVVSATNHPIIIAGQVFVRSAYAGLAARSVTSNLTTYTAEAEIGEDVFRTKLHDLLHFNASAVRNVALTSPTIDTELGDVEVPTFDISGLTFVTV